MTPSRVNREITGEKLRLADDSGEELGVFSLEDALELAKSRGQDLIEIDADDQPPLCKVMDYGKYRWQLQQAQKDRAHD